MKRRNLQLLLILVVGALALAGADTTMAQIFSARLDNARWQSVAGDGACHLTHEVPRFGLVLITESAATGLFATVLTRREPTVTRQGRAHGVSPAWKTKAERTLFTVTAQTGPTVLRLDAPQTAQTLETLESGDIVRFRFDTWRTDSAAIDLSPVGFRTALRRHMACAADLVESTPIKIAAEKPQAVAAGVARMATAHREETAMQTVATGEIEQLPAPPRFTVHFASDSASLDKPDYDTLKAAASAFSKQPFWSRILVTGHADRSGAVAYNRHLALLRAIEIRNRLVRLGIAEARVEVRSAGEGQPVAEAQDETQRAANRRVEIRALL